MELNRLIRTMGPPLTQMRGVFEILECVRLRARLCRLSRASHASPVVRKASPSMQVQLVVTQGFAALAAGK
jgi:hypothetical protein